MYVYSTLLQSIILFHIRYKELYFLVKTRSNNVKGTYMYTWFELEIFKFVLGVGIIIDLSKYEYQLLSWDSDVL